MLVDLPIQCVAREREMEHRIETILTQCQMSVRGQSEGIGEDRDVLLPVAHASHDAVDDAPIPTINVPTSTGDDLPGPRGNGIRFFEYRTDLLVQSRTYLSQDCLNLW